MSGRELGALPRVERAGLRRCNVCAGEGLADREQQASLEAAAQRCAVKLRSCIHSLLKTPSSRVCPEHANAASCLPPQIITKFVVRDAGWYERTQYDGNFYKVGWREERPGTLLVKERRHAGGRFRRQRRTHAGQLSPACRSPPHPLPTVRDAIRLGVR